MIVLIYSLIAQRLSDCIIYANVCLKMGINACRLVHLLN